MRSIRFGLATVSLCLLCFRGNAQLPSASQQVDTAERQRELEQRASSFTVSNAPALYPEEASDVGPQSVLRISRPSPWLEVVADAQYFFTDNMFFADKGKQHADVLVSTIQAAFTPEPFNLPGGVTLSPRAGYRHQWFDYGLLDKESIPAFDFNQGSYKTVTLHDFDFNSQTIFTDFTLKSGRWAAGLGFDYRRLMDTGRYDQFYREMLPIWGLRYTLPMGGRSALTLGYEGDYRFTDTAHAPPGFSSEFNDRTDHSLFASETLVLCKYAVAQTYYRFQYTRYTGGQHREDYLNSFGLALHCPITQQLSVRGFVGYDFMNTDAAFASNYRRLDAGGGVNVTCRF
jgi:hypothetical protein